MKLSVPLTSFGCCTRIQPAQIDKGVFYAHPQEATLVDGSGSDPGRLRAYH
jgi:hypothetical protein